MVCLLYSTFMIPFQVGFDVEQVGGMLVVDTMVDIIFWMVRSDPPATSSRLARGRPAPLQCSALHAPDA